MAPWPPLAQAGRSHYFEPDDEVSLLEPDDEVSLLEPEDPLIPEEEPELDPCFLDEVDFFVVVCCFVVVSDDDGAPELVSDEPVPLIVDDEPVPDEPVSEEPVAFEEPVLLPVPASVDAPEPDAPFDMMSRFSTFSVSPAPEKLARTWSPSLMSSMDAREPSRITCVLESTFSFLSLPESVSVLLDRSKFWTLPLNVSELPPVVPVGPLDGDDPMLLEPPRLPWLESRGEPDDLESEPKVPDFVSLLVP